MTESAFVKWTLAVVAAAVCVVLVAVAVRSIPPESDLSPVTPAASPPSPLPPPAVESSTEAFTASRGVGWECGSEYDEFTDATTFECMVRLSGFSDRVLRMSVVEGSSVTICTFMFVFESDPTMFWLIDGTVRVSHETTQVAGDASAEGAGVMFLMPDDLRDALLSASEVKVRVGHGEEHWITPEQVAAIARFLKETA